MGSERDRRQTSFKIVAGSDKHVQRLVDHLQSMGAERDRLLADTVEARLLPLFLDPNDPESRRIASDCLGRLQGYQLAIQTYFGLQLGTPVVTPMNMPLPQGDGKSADSGDDQDFTNGDGGFDTGPKRLVDHSDMFR